MTFDVTNPSFRLDDLLALELHKFEEEVGEIVDRAQKEEKMEVALAKLDETWSKVAFEFQQYKDTDIYTVKISESDFEVRWWCCWQALTVSPTVGGCTTGGTHWFVDVNGSAACVRCSSTPS